MVRSSRSLVHGWRLLKVLAGVIYLTGGVQTAWPLPGSPLPGSPLPGSPLPGSGLTPSPVRYVNTEFGFQIDLPESWRGYSVLTGRWTANDPNDTDDNGPTITLRHPSWTSTARREDMPIMVFTHEQWDRVQREELRISAAPIPPAALGQNSKYRPCVAAPLQLRPARRL